MDKKFMRLIEPGERLEIAILIAFALLSLLFSRPVGIAEIVIVGILYWYNKRAVSVRKKEIAKYVETMVFNVDKATKNTVMNFPLPTAVVNIETGMLIWGNSEFYELAGISDDIFEASLTDIAPNFDLNWVIRGSKQCPNELSIGDRKLSVYGSLVGSGGYSTEQGKGLLVTLYFVDSTDFFELRETYAKSKPVVAVYHIDNYEELLKNCSETEKSTILASIDKAINQWSDVPRALLKRYDRDKYLFIFEEQYLNKLTTDRFRVLDAVKEVQSAAGIQATLSIGLGCSGDGLGENFDFAGLAVEMALSRGGDQAVIKNKTNFEFYGGRVQGAEKRTKVRSRVLANALWQLIRDSSYVFIMGHKMSDLDSIGAAAGIACVVRKAGKKAYIVTDRESSNARELIERLAELPEYEDVFINAETAMLLCDNGSLTIVVDTNRPEVVEHQPLLQCSPKIAVIDHHRRAASYIENAAVNMHEPYASSASELATELMQYTVTAKDVLKTEAEALLAGIYLDTKEFSLKTGVRTFEAAAYLKRLGADTIEIKKMFQNDFVQYVEKNRLVERAVMKFGQIAVAKAEFDVSRPIAGQAADDLLSITGIRASVVLFRCDGKTYASARSLGQINVQLIMEKIGGGGSLANAGAQLDMSLDEAEELLDTVLEEYFNEA